MILSIFIFALFISSLIIAVEPKNVQIDNTTKPYIIRVIYAFAVLSVAAFATAWITILPILGILTLL